MYDASTLIHNMTNVTSITRIVEESFRGSVYPGDEDEAIFAVNDGSIPEFMEMIRGKDWKGFLDVLKTEERFCSCPARLEEVPATRKGEILSRMTQASANRLRNNRR